MISHWRFPSTKRTKTKVGRKNTLSTNIASRVALVTEFQIYIHTYTGSKEEESKMQIKVKTLTGRDMAIDVEPQDKIIRIKEMMEEKEGISPAQQRLIFNGSLLNDDQTIQESGVQAGSSLHLVLTLRGGN